MDAQQLSDVAAWTDTYSEAAREAEMSTALAVWAAYSSISDWYDPRQTIEAVTEAVSTITRMLDLIDGLTSAYQGNVIGILTGQPVTQPPRPALVYPRPGVEVRAVYDRPVWTYRDTIARGGTEVDAFLAARLHADLLANTDAILAERAATQITYRSQAIKKYRRVIRPELSLSGACGLCVAAASQVYRVEDLMPIHDRCKCGVLPILKGNDPGAAMNAEDLQQLYGDAGGKSRAALKKTRYRVDEHGELGPVLVAKTAKRVDKATAWDDPARVQKELDALLPVLDSLLARDAAGENVAGPLGYQTARIAKLRSLLAA